MVQSKSKIKSQKNFKVETSSAYHKEFEVMIEKIFKELWRRLDEQRDK